MRLYNYLNSKLSIIGALSLLIGLTSCGSYQYASYDTDGIYGEPEQNVEYTVNNVEYQDTPNTKETNNSAYYKNYFKEKATEIDNMNGDIIFTDIDSYEGSYKVENDSLEYQENYAGWGYSDNITVNIYNRQPLYSSFWYPRYSWYNNWNFGFGYYDYWYSPYYVGWNRPYWHSYYGFYGYGYPYYYGGYPYYYGYNNYYYGNRNRRTYAYNAGRRGSIYSNNNTSGITTRSAITNRRSSINSRATNLRNNATRSSSSRVNTTGSSRTRVNSQSIPTRSSRVGNSTSTRSRSATTRSSRSSTTRSNNNSSRRSNNISSSNRSSNSTSTRSSGRSNSSRRNN